MNETLDEQSRRALVSYRVDRAEETLHEAELLASFCVKRITPA